MRVGSATETKCCSKARIPWIAATTLSAELRLSDGSPRVAAAAGSFDRFVSNYVFDLLSEEETRAALAEAHRLLAPGGLLCLAGLAPGCTLASRIVSRLWGWVQRIRPSLVGGCRPIRLLEVVDEKSWEGRFHRSLASFGVASEALVASRRDRG